MSYPDQLDVLAGADGVGTGGIPSGFVALAVLAALVSAGIFVRRIALARRMADEAGMDPDRSTAVTLLDDSGLGATYVASSLRPTAAGETHRRAVGPQRQRATARAGGAQGAGTAV